MRIHDRESGEPRSCSDEPLDEPEPSKLYENASEIAPLGFRLLRSARVGHSSWVPLPS
jgi:hypothetical protein